MFLCQSSFKFLQQKTGAVITILSNKPNKILIQTFIFKLQTNKKFEIKKILKKNFIKTCKFYFITTITVQIAKRKKYTKNETKNVVKS